MQQCQVIKVVSMKNGLLSLLPYHLTTSFLYFSLSLLKFRTLIGMNVARTRLMVRTRDLLLSHLPLSLYDHINTDFVKSA
jgi:hypothetical protein